MNRSSEFSTRTRPRAIVATVIAAGILIAFLGAASVVVYSGAYDIAADTPHGQPVYWLLQKVRQYSIAARAHDVVPNDLGDAN